MGNQASNDVGGRPRAFTPTDSRSLDHLCKSLKGMSKDKWGRKCWDFLHNRSISWHRRASPLQVAQEHAYLQSLFSRLPCKDCSRHALDHYHRVPPDLTSNYHYHNWMFSFHNSVNERLGKPHFSYSEYISLYSNPLRKNNLI